jgi:transcriptional regulator with XRE-family HTH domain
VTVAERFAENLLILRRRAKQSQEDVGFGAGLHRTEIGSLERGERLPRIDTLVKLAGALGVTPADLLKRLDWKTGAERPGRFRIEGEGGS